jgi:hypothetical protein
MRPAFRAPGVRALLAAAGSQDPRRGGELLLRARRLVIVVD